MFNAKTHRASCFWMLPEAPYLWNVHFVILKWKRQHFYEIVLNLKEHTYINHTYRGNTSSIGSLRFSWFILGFEFYIEEEKEQILIQNHHWSTISMNMKNLHLKNWWHQYHKSRKYLPKISINRVQFSKVICFWNLNSLTSMKIMFATTLIKFNISQKK